MGNSGKKVKELILCAVFEQKGDKIQAPTKTNILSNISAI